MAAATTLIDSPLARRAAATPDALCLTDGTEALSYAAAEQRVRCICSRLASLGIPRGARLGVLSHNSLSYALTVHAAPRLGISVLLLNPRLTPRQWTDQLHEAGAKVLLVGAELAAKAHEIGLPQHELESLAIDSAAKPPEPIDPDAEATLLYTSGSTGSGKAVPLTLRNHLTAAEGSNIVTGLSAGDCWLLALPLCHVGGLEILFRTALAGAAAFVCARAAGDQILGLLAEGRLTHLSLVPTVLEDLLERQAAPLLSRLKVVLLGGAAPPGRLIQQVSRLGLPVRTSYGMTETTAHVTATQAADGSARLHTSGRALSHVSLSILDAEGAMRPPNAAGEIAVSGPSVFSGYATAGAVARRHGGYFLTGDLGYLDEDGFLHVLGRRDGMFISGGENIYPQEIERAALELASVASAAVVPRAHRRWGQRPVLFVETRQPGAFALDTLEQHLAAILPRIKQPDQIRVLAALPRTVLDKVDYRALEALAEEADTAEQAGTSGRTDTVEE